MKSFIIALAYFLITFEATAQKVKDTIFWSPCYKLNWMDFKGKLESSADFDAISSIGFDYDINEQIADKIKDVSVFNFFNRAESKVKGDFDSTLLQHEQGHFNISELFTRKLFKEFKKQILVKNGLTLSETEVIYLTIKKQYDAVKILYDYETDYSRNIFAQQNWTIKIDKELTETKPK